MLEVNYQKYDIANQKGNLLNDQDLRDALWQLSSPRKIFHHLQGFKHRCKTNGWKFQEDHFF